MPAGTTFRHNAASPPINFVGPFVFSSDQAECPVDTTFLSNVDSAGECIWEYMVVHRPFRPCPVRTRGTLILIVASLRLAICTPNGGLKRDLHNSKKPLACARGSEGTH
jgi:hypothetical protein